MGLVYCISQIVGLAQAVEKYCAAEHAWDFYEGRSLQVAAKYLEILYQTPLCRIIEFYFNVDSMNQFGQREAIHIFSLPLFCFASLLMLQISLIKPY